MSVFTSAHLEQFIFNKMNKRALKISTLTGYRSAICDIYRPKNVAVPSDYVDGINTFFRGLKRVEADNDQSGDTMNPGKQPLTVSLYQQICQDTMELLDNGFTNLFLVLQWNLMCRSKSVEMLHINHFSCENDNIGCVLHKTKTNQEGSGPKDSRQIYANPMNPSVCCFLAMGFYFASNRSIRPGTFFPGANQKGRFAKRFGAILKCEAGSNAYATHSIRKGVATFASSGSTGGPSMASVCLRCGWSLSGVQDRYIRYEAAGDQMLGRVVAGLPLDSPSFACPPPHFGDPNDTVVNTALEKMFPSLSSTPTHATYSLALSCIVGVPRITSKDSAPKPTSGIGVIQFSGCGRY